MKHFRSAVAALACLTALATPALAIPTLAAPATAAAASAAAGRTLTLTGTGTTMWPAFSEDVPRYGISTTGSATGTVKVTATPAGSGGRVIVNGDPPPAPPPTTRLEDRTSAVS